MSLSRNPDAAPSGFHYFSRPEDGNRTALIQFGVLVPQILNRRKLRLQTGHCAMKHDGTQCPRLFSKAGFSRAIVHLLLANSSQVHSYGFKRPLGGCDKVFLYALSRQIIAQVELTAVHTVYLSAGCHQDDLGSREIAI